MNRRPSCGSAGRAFTLVELMAVIAVVTILLSLLVPTVTAARRAAYRVVSAGNQRSLGQGVIMFAGGNRGKIPPSRVLDEFPLDLSELMRVYVPPIELGDNGGFSGKFAHNSLTPGERYMAQLQLGNTDFGWDGLGHLFRGNFISEPKVFYSPAHSGDHQYEDIKDQWMHPDSGRLPEQTIYSNFHYVGDRDEFGRDIKLDRNPERVIIADGLRTCQDMNHNDGLNLLWADNSVHWFSCPALFKHLSIMPRGADQPPKRKQNDIIRSIFNGTLVEQLNKYQFDPNT